MLSNQLLFTYFFVALILSSFVSSTKLDKKEVAALNRVAKELKKSNWDFTVVDPCDLSSQGGGWRDFSNPKGSEDVVTCNCSSVVCHVTSIVLKIQDLQGSLPTLTGLPFLQEIDLSRNYLTGSLPTEWAALPLVNITLLGNRINGPIPKEYGSLKNLHSFVLDYNQISGELPPELGNLKNIQRLFVSSNYLTGEIPSTFANLTTLIDFRISDNKFNGTIPDFIQNWTKLEKLVIQASGLVGPIPSGIFSLGKLRDLRISDLSGPESLFPPLQNMNLKTLVLRNCNLTGDLPEYLGNKSSLKML
ncbi:putative leucine-rich repeat receptor-like serine/threonine-protein kinase [Cardamine amara subsp. amara]|uniref:Leucine-rich repeat receptor-like serine/threonine-protein kinase n=1 Tax=Cardamine amara subsp. amara TaxID=228776 RepID=A0ABD1A2B0_CARAN